MKFKKLYIALFLVCLLASPVHAVVIATMGDYNSSGNYKMEIDSDQYLTYYDLGIKKQYEIMATNDSIDANETGTTFIVKMTSDTASTNNTVTVTLPAAAVGLEYTIAAGDDVVVYLDPASTSDYIFDSVIGYTGAGGWKLASPGNTGDSVTVLCPVANSWMVTDMNGAWTNGKTTQE